MIKEQQKIDESKIIYYYKALEKGIPLHGDPVYEELILTYPYYQERLRSRQMQLNRIKKLQANPDEKVIKYKFEEKYKGRSNLT